MVDDASREPDGLSPDLRFLAGGGAASRLILGRDWSAHPLGPPAGWSDIFKSNLSTVLNSPESMILAWGRDELSFFFNEAYIPLLGPRLSWAMGAPFRDVWADAWDQARPIIDDAFAGQSQRFTDLPWKLGTDRGSADTWFSFSYSRVLDPQGDVAGLLIYTTETTQRVLGDAALRQSEERLRLVIEGAKDHVIFTTDTAGIIMTWSAGAVAILGWTADEAIGQPAAMIFTPSDRAVGADVQELAGAARDGSAPDERWHLKKDGSQVFLNGSVHPLPTDAQGLARGFIKIARDDTQRWADQQTLRNLNETLEERVAERTAERDRMWNTSPDLMLVIDADGVFRRVNPAWTRVLGYAPEDLLGHHVNEFVVAEDHAKTVEAYEDAAVGGLPRIENRYRHRDGSTRCISWVAASDEQITYATGRDVTEQREREQTLRDTQDFIRLALSAVGGVGVWTFDVASDRFYFDAGIAGLYALDPKDGPGGLPRTEFLANVLPEDQAALRATMSGGLVRPGDLELEYRIRHPDGSVRYVLSRGHTYFDEAGVAIRRTGVGIDTTNRHALQDQLRQSQKLEAVGQLTGGVAHDFNNLLTIIRSSVDFLKREDLPAARRDRYVAAISDTVDRAAKLTNQLLAFARRQPLKPQVFEVCARVRDVSNLIRPLMGGRIAIIVEACDQPCHTEADVSQFETALVNLAVNARDAMQGEGDLTLTVREVRSVPAIRGHTGAAGDFIAVSVSDTGEGIAADATASIFEPFYTTKDVGKGTGLGLSQVFGFTKQSGGEVAVESQVGVGSTFTLYLPRVAPEDSHARSAEPDVTQARTPRTLRVLIVEDNESVGRFADEMLQDLGYRTRLAGNATEALRTIETDPTGFDVVFSDVIMPGMNGVEMAKEMQRRWPDLPVVLTSGYSNILAQQGSHGFELLRKPYSIDELSRTLHQVVAIARPN